MITSPLIRSGRAEAQVFISDVECLRETREGRQYLLRGAGGLIAHCVHYAETARRRWAGFEDDAEGHVLFVDDLAHPIAALIALAETYQAAVAAVRKGLEVAERSRCEWLEEDGPPPPPPDLTLLDSVAERLAALKAEIITRWEWLKTPAERHRPLRTTEEIRASLRRGEYLSVEEAMAQATQILPEAS